MSNIEDRLTYTCYEDIDEDSDFDSYDGDAIGLYLQKFVDCGPFPKTITLYTYRIKQVDDDHFKNEAEVMLENFSERWCEEYGDFSNGPDETFPPAIVERLAAVLSDWAAINGGPHQIEDKPIAQTPIDVKQWITDNEPDWLEGATFEGDVNEQV